MIEDIEDWLATQEAYDLFAEIIAERDQHKKHNNNSKKLGHKKYHKKNKLVCLVLPINELDLFLENEDLP